MRGRTDGQAQGLPGPRRARWRSRRVLLAIAIVGLALVALPVGAGGLADRLVLLYLPLLLAVGLAPRRPPLRVVLPATAVSFVVGFGASGDLTIAVVVHFVLVLAVGTALVGALEGRPAADGRGAVGTGDRAGPAVPPVALELAALVDGTRALEGARGIDDAVVLFERGLVDLLGADDAVVRVAGHGAGVPGGPATPRDRAAPDDPAIPAAPVRFLAEPSARVAEPALEALLPGAHALLVVPLGLVDAPVGVAVVGWTRPVGEPNAEVVQAVALLAAEATEAIERGLGRQQQDAAPLTDPLTGLLSRRMIRTRLSDLERGDAVVVLDLDNFRAYNERWGVGAGDRTVRTLAACLVDSCRRDDWCGRLSDEEFIVVFRGAGPGASVAVARLRERWADLGTEATFSAGVALHQRGQGPADTLAHAEGALDLAKDRGRDRFELFPGESLLDER